MTEKEMMLFAYQQSPEPIIKNRVLSDALDKDLGPRNTYAQGQLVSNTVDGSRPGYSGGKLASEVTKALNKIKPYSGATTIGKSSPKLNRKPELNFIKLFNKLKEKNFSGNLRKTSESIGQSPEKIKGIFNRTLGPGSKSSGHKPVISIPEPKNGILYSQTTTNMKSNPEAFKELITPQTKDLYLSPRDIASKLGINFKGDKGQYDFFVKDLKDLKVTNKASSGTQKLFNFDDATNKILNKYKTKKIKGERLADSNRLEIEIRLDPELYKVRNNNKNAIKTISKNENIYLTNAIDDVGHTVSIKITDKYPRLFKDSNVNNINSLVYQDPYLNQDVMKLTGYETRFDSMFKELETLVNKPVTVKTQKKILDIKQSMNQNYNGLIKNLTDPVALKYIMKRSGKDISPSHLKTLSQQTNRIPKIDVKVPKIGEKFLSENIYADMSKVDPQYIMGYVNQINPTAKKFKDLSLSEQALYKANLQDQSGMIVRDYYKKVGYPKGQLDELQEAVTYDNYASGGKVASKALARGFNKVGGPFEVGIAALDFINNLDSMDADEAFKTALSNVTFGAYKGDKKEQMETLNDAAGELGYKNEGFNELKEVIDLQKLLKSEELLLADMQNYNKTDKTGLQGNFEDLDLRKDFVLRLEKELYNKEKSLYDKKNFDEIATNYEQTVDYVARKQYNKNIDRENKLFFGERKDRVNPDMNVIGDGLWQALTDWGSVGGEKSIPYPKTLLPQNFLQNEFTKGIPNALRKLPVVGKYFDPTSERAKLFDMSEEDKIKRAESLNAVRQNYHPVMGNSMNYEQMEPFYEKYYAQGGLASLKRKL